MQELQNGGPNRGALFALCQPKPFVTSESTWTRTFPWRRT